MTATPWIPLFLTFPRRDYAFGGSLIREKLHKSGVPEGHLAETWEVSDYGSVQDSATILNGPWQGRPLRELVQAAPHELVGPNFDGPHFPLLAKFLDASHMLPVHLHANDQTARRKYGQPNGKTEAWHILWAAPGASILAGIKPGVQADELRQALREGRYDDVMPRWKIQSGDTVYIPGGVLHSFGPDTLVYEIQQTSDLGVSAMPHDLYGQPLTPQQWEANLDDLLDELVWEPQPRPHPGLTLGSRRLCALGPHFALERVAVQGEYHWNFAGAQILTTLGPGLELVTEQGVVSLAAAQSVLLPAIVGGATLRGTGEVLISYVPDLNALKAELAAAGHSAEGVAALGEVDSVEHSGAGP